MEAARAEGRQIGVALSGGGDSTALLHLLAERFGPDALRAATLDHGLRDGSAGEAARAGADCRTAGISHDILTWNGAAARGNLQDAARRARYARLTEWAARAGIGHVALGHTSDDNAETFLMGLSRGAGLDGLSGMRRSFVREGCVFLRPLLGTSRAELRVWLRLRGLRWSEDPSNEDARFDRIKARNALALMAPLGIDAERLGLCIANLRGSRAAIEDRLACWARDHVGQDRGDLLIDPGALCDLPADLQRRLLGAALRWISGRDYPPRAAALRAAAQHAAEARQAGTAGTRTLHGCLLQFGTDKLRIGREPRAAAAAPPRPAGELWDGRWRIIGSASQDAATAALGAKGLAKCPDWRGSGLPRSTLLASPALWDGDILLAAPLAMPNSRFHAVIADTRDDFIAGLLSH